MFVDDGSGSGTAGDRIEDTPFDLSDNNTLMLAERASIAKFGRVSRFANTYTYTGRRLDEKTGLHYYRYRYYEARMGRFVGRDPAKSPWNNLYGYTGNRVTWGVDPFGLATSESETVMDGTITVSISDPFLEDEDVDICGKVSICVTITIESTSALFKMMMEEDVYDIMDVVQIDDWDINEVDIASDDEIAEDDYSDLIDKGESVGRHNITKTGPPWRFNFCYRNVKICDYADGDEVEVEFEMDFDIVTPESNDPKKKSKLKGKLSSVIFDTEEFELESGELVIDCGCCDD